MDVFYSFFMSPFYLSFRGLGTHPHVACLGSRLATKGWGERKWMKGSLFSLLHRTSYRTPQDLYNSSKRLLKHWGEVSSCRVS